MQTLEPIFLQDMAVLQPDFPRLTFFNMPLFATTEWTEFSALVRTANAQDILPQSLLLQRALPEVNATLLSATSALRAGQNTIMEQGNRHHSSLQRELRAGASETSSSLRLVTNNLARIERMISGPVTFQFGTATNPVWL